MFEPSKRISEITESETLAMTKRARELRESGKDVISLSIGEPDFHTPIHICEAAFKAMKDGITHYPPVLGLMAFREAICRKLERENGDAPRAFNKYRMPRADSCMYEQRSPRRHAGAG